MSTDQSATGNNPDDAMAHNFRVRVSLGQFPEQGAAMMWGTTHTDPTMTQDDDHR